MLFVLFCKSPTQVDLVEAHKEIKTPFEARKVLKQWMEEDDWLSQEETIQDHKGRYITPLVIVTSEGETADIFGQLVTSEPPA